MRGRKDKYMEKRKVTKRMAKAVMLTVIMTTLMAATAYADTESEVNEVLRPLILIKSLITGAVSIVGYILCVKNLMEAFTAYQQNDQHTFTTALKGFIGSLLMAAISTVLTFLGL